MADCATLTATFLFLETYSCDRRCCINIESLSEALLLVRDLVTVRHTEVRHPI